MSADGLSDRLGGLGFFATEESKTAPETHGSTGGMNGLLDQITALQWVQANAHRFGGNASAVTIAGESAGGESVCNLMVSPVAKGLFVRAIIESGPCLVGSRGWGPHDRTVQLAACGKLAKKLTGKAAPTLADLRAVKDPRGFIKITIKDSVDDYVIPRQPSEYFATGRLNTREVLLGGNSFDGLGSYTVPHIASPKTGMIPEATYEYEMKSSWGGDSGRVQQLYGLQARFGGNTNPAFIQPDGDASVVCPTLEVARKVHAAGGRAYVFHWAHNGCYDLASCPSCRLKEPADYASHASEIPYVWGDGGSACYPNPKVERLTRAMQEYWGSFTRTGVPVSATAGVAWPAFDAATESSMRLSTELAVVARLKVSDCTALHAINSSFWPV